MPNAGYANTSDIPATLLATSPTTPLPSPGATPSAPDLFASLYGSITKPGNPSMKPQANVLPATANPLSTPVTLPLSHPLSP